MIPFCNYFILDAAQIETELVLAQKLNKENRCLYMGESEQNLKYVAPYLFTHQTGSDFSNWILLKKNQSHLGYFINTKADFEQLYKHLRTLLFVTTEEKEELYFRFYDPSVARIFLPTCDAMQIREFFGPINFIVVETETPNLFKQFWHENGLLREKEFEYRAEEIENLDDKMSQWKLEIDQEQEKKDMEEVDRINKLYNKEEKVIIPNPQTEQAAETKEAGVAKEEVISGNEAISGNEVIVESKLHSGSNIVVDKNNVESSPKSNSERKNKGWRLFD